MSYKFAGSLIEEEFPKKEIGLDLNFVADRVAEVDSLLTFVISCAQSSKDFQEFQSLLQNGLGKVKLTHAIDVEKWLDDQKGYVVVGKFGDGEIDYYRDDDGLPVVFDSSHFSIPGFTAIHTIDLKERREKRDT